MPVTPTYPGVYVTELESPVHTIVGVPTSVAAFVGFAARGVTDTAIEIHSWSDYERAFGSLDQTFPMSYAVYLFLLNGGTSAYVVRTVDSANGGAHAELPLSGDIALVAKSPGSWANQLRATVDTKNLIAPNDPTNAFNVLVAEPVSGASEFYAGVTIHPGPRFLPDVLAASQLVTVDPPPKGKTSYASVPAAHTYYVTPPAGPPAGAAGGGAGGGPAGGAGGGPEGGGGAAGGGAAAGGAAGGGAAGGGAAGGGAAGGGAAGGAGDGGGAAGAGNAGAPAAPPAATPGTDGNTDQPPLGDEGAMTGIYALKKVDIFNILCLPVAPEHTHDAQTLSTAAEFCQKRRAMLIVDPPSDPSSNPWTGNQLQVETVAQHPAISPSSSYAAQYYPNLIVTDERTKKQLTVGPSGAVAGVWAATDAGRGVWKAPAGTEATISGITDLGAHIDDPENGDLNQIGVNCLRTMPLVGPLVWGARTTKGVDQFPDQWKYLPVRRTALFIEESLRRGTQWVVFEPNDEPLWASIRLNVGAFMNGLFRQGAFEGSTPQEAYLVKCDLDNNPQSQIDLGIVNILVGFAPLKPAEFVIISIQQQTGQV